MDIINGGRELLVLAVSKERINYLINQLSEKDLGLITDIIERLAQNNKQTNISIDDEPTTEDDLSAIRAAHKAIKQGELINLKDIEHELRN
ncbi:hypothetical protein [Paenibacillus puerhi]|uniref:hypothetical protein n=1 Tax=Paenibacillus puerhi TaxID=2692622 RepID=UPI00135A9467|nr:hypothetical protein [Paenibacillus puerhi]